MQKIIHITDTHLRAPGERVLGLDPAERLRAVVRSVNENHADAAVCIVTGDLTDRGEEAAYGLLRDCLAPLRVPHRLLLGNHDARAAFRAVFPGMESDDHGFIQGTVAVGETLCVLLDTLDEPRPGAGFLCRRRLSWLDRQLAAAAGRQVIAFLHHPPLSIGLRWFDGMLLDNGAELMARLRRHGTVAHIVFGHVHVNASGTWGGMSFSASRGTCHKILSDPAAEQADYVDQGPAYDVLLIGQGGVCVHSIDPAGPNDTIAREYATADGRGAFEMVGAAEAPRWM